MIKAAAMKNDKLDADLAAAFDSLQVDIRNLSTLSWMVQSVADSNVPPPRQDMTLLDAVCFAMEMLDEKAAPMDKTAAAARLQLHERMQAAR
jgi:hypothetical protein